MGRAREGSREEEGKVSSSCLPLLRASIHMALCTHRLDRRASTDSVLVVFIVIRGDSLLEALVADVLVSVGW